MRESLRDPRRRPTHPGAILREVVLPELQMSQTELARRLGVSRLTVSEIVHEKRRMSPELAARIGKLLGTTPDIWLNMQIAVDLWDVRHQSEKLKAIVPIENKQIDGIL